MQYCIYMYSPAKLLSSFIFIFLSCCISCKNKHGSKDRNNVINPSEMNAQVKLVIDNILNTAEKNENKLKDSSLLTYNAFLKNYYFNTGYEPIWSSKQEWLPQAALLVKYIENAGLQGLYKEDYHFVKLINIKSVLDVDSIKKMDAVLWANADLLMSEAYAGLLKDLRQGRLLPDSLSWRNDSAKFRIFFAPNFDRIKNGEHLNNILEAVQPQHAGYKSLKKTLQKFIDSMDTRTYTYLVYPYKDSIGFLKLFKKRMNEAGIVIPINADSLQLSSAIKQYQKTKGLTADGKIGNNIIKNLNLTGKQKFNTIAITLDKYKLLPEVMPPKYIWVNLPAYHLKVWSADTIVLESKIICGKPNTPTPILTSAISDLVLYPTWTVPTSIISKEMLPGLKRNTSYLARKGLYLLNGKGEKINPANINWAKYTKGIPYRIQQGSGDGNALGVIKFNFKNPFSVYLHDTNQRYLFKNSVRSLSHGCVRVQEWQKLANFLIRNDSMNLKRNDSMHYNTDSIINWIAHKEKHTIEVKNKMPLYIRYFSCENINGSIKFYDDIYGEDKDLKQKFFAGK